VDVDVCAERICRCVEEEFSKRVKEIDKDRRDSVCINREIFVKIKESFEEGMMSQLK